MPVSFPSPQNEQGGPVRRPEARAPPGCLRALAALDDEEIRKADNSFKTLVADFFAASEA